MSVSLGGIRAKITEGKIKEALSQIEEIERKGLICPAILVSKGCCIQLDDEHTHYTLSEAEQCFKQALEIDEDYTPAMVQLAWFYLNVLDDAERATPLFEKAVASYRQDLTEAVLGRVKCLVESETTHAAKSYFDDVSRACLDADEIRNFLEDEEADGRQLEHPSNDN